MERVLKSKPLWGTHRYANLRGGRVLAEREPEARLLGYLRATTDEYHHPFRVVLQRPDGKIAAYFWDVGECGTCGLKQCRNAREIWLQLSHGRVVFSPKRALTRLLTGNAGLYERWVIDVASKAGAL